MVPGERLERWLLGFAQRHGGTPPLPWQATPEVVTVRADDGAVAECRVPFPPLHQDDAVAYSGLIQHVTRERLVGVVLVRRGGYAAGVFEGRRLIASKVGSRLVQGRAAAGGWSQQRFARRREKQAREAYQAAADVVARVVLPHVDRLEAVVVGGDERSVRQVLEDPRLNRLRDLVAQKHLDVPDPRLKVLQAMPDRFRAVQIRLTEPES